jgi:hypothetical protein
MTLTDWQEVVSIVVPIVVSAVGATFWITHKITKLEDKVKEIERNPLLEAFRTTTLDRAKRLVKMDELIKGFEAQKIGEEKK